jgi:hypothetical protein
MTAVTSINFDDSEDDEVPQVILTESNLYQTIMNFEVDVNTRIKALERYNKQLETNESSGNSIMELLSQLSGMYHFSGTKTIEYFLLRSCTHATVPALFKVEAAKSLLTFEEDEMDSDDEDEEEKKIIRSRNKLIQERNNKRKTSSFKALDCACYDLTSLPTPCKIESVCMLMESPEYKNQSISYFIEIISDQCIDCDYRYKTILSLEQRMDDTGNITFEKWRIPEREFFIEKACFAFLCDSENLPMYRILSGQYLLQKLEINSDTQHKIQEVLLKFAEDDELDYNLRADAADTLLSLGESETKTKAREIIMILGRAMGDVKNVFDNAQNVHVDEIEKSVAEALEFLSGMSLLEVAGRPIDFSYVNNQINSMLEDKRKNTRDHIDTGGEGCGNCTYCEKKTDEKTDEKYFCSLECVDFHNYSDKIQIALNRINVDRILYSKFNQTLVNILLKVWTYLSEHESCDVMKQRMFEELWDMSGTCSSGFASRLVNVISGFGNFNMRISWEDQIVANFTGRLNARARDITEKDSLYYQGDRYRDIVELYMRSHGMLDKRTEATDLENKVTKNDLINTYIEVDKELKTEKAVEEFAENVLNEMMIPSSQYGMRPNFIKFFRDNAPNLMEELRDEFKDLVDEASIDLYLRKALIIYEGAN